MMVVELTGRGYDTAKSEFRGVWAHGNNTFAIKYQINLPEPPL